MNTDQIEKVTDMIVTIQYAIQGAMNEQNVDLEELSKRTGLSKKQLNYLQGDCAELQPIKDLLLVLIALNVSLPIK